MKLLERLIAMRRSFMSASAMALIVQHVPAERERVVTTTLAGDESWILQPPVMNYLHTCRQDLLTPFLGQRAYSGRFSTGRVQWILPFMSGFHRWTDAQQEIFATSLVKLAKKTSVKKTQITWELLSVIRRLPALPAIDAKRLIKLARDKRPVVQETAVRALGRLDARQGVPELLEALDDARARHAVYALRSALSEMPPLRVLEIMREVPLRKVTVAKEAIRLAGEFGGREVLEWFAVLDRRSLHRDVRGALLRALWDHLERPEAWAILDSSMESPDLGVVIGLARIQVERASNAARERVANMLRRLLDHAEPTVRLAVLGRLAAQPVPDPKRVLLTATLGKFASEIPDERSGALLAAISAARDSDADAFAHAFTRLLPKRRELAASVEKFASVTARFGERLVKVRTAVLAALETDPAIVSLQIPMAFARFAAEPFARWVLKWVGGDRWHTSTQTVVLAAITGSGRPAEEFEQAEKLWAASTDPAARWLPLRPLVHVASEQGWTEPRRERLRRYTKDPSPVVADEAAMTFPPEPPSGLNSRK